MKTAKEIRNYFDGKKEKALKKLRDKCRHPKVTDWIEQWWAVGHSTGKQVRVCEICERVVEERPNAQVS